MARLLAAKRLIVALQAILKLRSIDLMKEKTRTVVSKASNQNVVEREERGWSDSKSQGSVMKREGKGSEEKTPFDEHANEDRYFATKEKELIDELKFEFQSAEVARREAQMMTCPKCSGKFAKYRILGFDLDRCENCEGIWLNKGELAGILRQQARGPLGAFLDRWFAKDENARQVRKGLVGVVVCATMTKR